jgi:hypothetical protein
MMRALPLAEAKLLYGDRLLIAALGALEKGMTPLGFFTMERTVFK